MAAGVGSDGGSGAGLSPPFAVTDFPSRFCCDGEEWDGVGPTPISIVCDCPISRGGWEELKMFAVSLTAEAITEEVNTINQLLRLID